MKWDILWAVIVSYFFSSFPLFPSLLSQRNPLTNSQECLSIFVVKVVKIFPKIAGKNEKYKQKQEHFLKKRLQDAL